MRYGVLGDYTRLTAAAASAKDRGLQSRLWLYDELPYVAPLGGL